MKIKYYDLYVEENVQFNKSIQLYVLFNYRKKKVMVILNVIVFIYYFLIWVKVL